MRLLELYRISEIDWSKFPMSKDPVNVADPGYGEKMAARKKALGGQTSTGGGIDWVVDRKFDGDDLRDFNPEVYRGFIKLSVRRFVDEYEFQKIWEKAAPDDVWVVAYNKSKSGRPTLLWNPYASEWVDPDDITPETIESIEGAISARFSLVGDY